MLIPAVNASSVGLADIEALQYADVNATSLVNGTEYIITDIGNSDFTTAGATLNTNGTIFTANVSGISGTGVVTATTGTDYINESNIILPGNKRPVSTETMTITQVHNERLKLIIDNVLNSKYLQKDDLTIVVVDCK